MARFGVRFTRIKEIKYKSADCYLTGIEYKLPLYAFVFDEVRPTPPGETESETAFLSTSELRR